MGLFSNRPGFLVRDKARTLATASNPNLKGVPHPALLKAQTAVGTVAPPAEAATTTPPATLETFPDQLATPAPTPTPSDSPDSSEAPQIRPSMEALRHMFDTQSSTTLQRAGYYPGNPRRHRPARIYYELHGTGPTKLILIMGLNSTSAFWKLQLEYFAALPEYQVCVFDNRGIGRSEAAAGSYSITTFAKDTLDLLDYLGWTQPVHVAGVSLGGMITQKLVLMAATRFISATFISTYHSAVFAMPTVGDVRYFLQSLTGSKDEITEHLLRLCFSKKWLSSAYNDRTSLTNRDMLMGAFNIIKTETPLSKAKQEADFNQLTATWWHNLTPWQILKLKKSPTRILVMHGSKDKVIRSACGRALAMMLNCPFDLFEGSGHMIMIDNHDKFNRDLQAHLENRRGPRMPSGAETPDDLSDNLADEVYPTLTDDSNAVPPPLTPPSEANLQSSVPWIPGSASTGFRIPSPPTPGRVTKTGTFSTLFNRRGSDQDSEGPRPLNRPQTTVPNSPTFESNAAGQRALH